MITLFNSSIRSGRWIKIFVGLLVGAELASAATPTPSPTPQPIATELDALAPGAWTVVWVTDTQYYTEAHRDIGIFLKMTDWVRAQADARKIRMVWHTGDVVDNNDRDEWQRAKACMDVLNGRVPYILSLGNHDMGERGAANTRETFYNDYFHLADNPLNADHFGGRFEAGRLDNTYWFLEEGPWKLMIFSLEFGVRPEAAAWAGGIAALHPERQAVLLTHDFLDDLSRAQSDDGWARRTLPASGASAHHYGIGKTTPERALTGQGIWDALVSRHGNFALTLNGHQLGWELDAAGKPVRTRAAAASYRMDAGAAGQPVHQMFFNAQAIPDGGAGWLRLLEFQPDGVTVLVKTYSPLYASDNNPETPAWHPDPRMHFSIRLK